MLGQLKCINKCFHAHNQSQQEAYDKINIVNKVFGLTDAKIILLPWIHDSVTLTDIKKVTCKVWQHYNIATTVIIVTLDAYNSNFTTVKIFILHLNAGHDIFSHCHMEFLIPSNPKLVIF